MEHPFLHSEEIDKIAPAFVAAQAEMESAPKSADNPYFNSRYAPLPAIVEMLRPILAKHELAIMQTFTPHEGESVLLSTTLLHSSGQWLGGVLSVPVKKADPQAVGSAITYGRRYSLSALLGVVSDDDDDGNAAADATERAEASQPRPQQRPSAAIADAGMDAEFGTWHGRLLSCEKTEGEKNGKPWTRYALKCPDSPIFSTFDTTDGDKAETLVGEPVQIAWQRKGKFYNLVDIFPEETA